jgi:3-carboxy-cis,cis-muconate cycloisomerase
MILLGPKMGRDQAHKLLEEATRRSVEQNKRLKDVLAEMKEVQQHMNAEDLRSLEDPEAYLGSAEEFRRRAIATIEKDQTKKHKG